MNTTHFVMMNNMNTTNVINQMNMIHMMNNHHNTTEMTGSVTGVDMVIIIIGFFLLIGGGVKITEWMLDKTYKMKEPCGSIVFLSVIISYVIIGVIVISFFTYLF